VLLQHALRLFEQRHDAGAPRDAYDGPLNA
jgi:hypothetical protein